jgi:hypothetical protein
MVISKLDPLFIRVRDQWKEQQRNDTRRIQLARAPALRDLMLDRCGATARRRFKRLLA